MNSIETSTHTLSTKQPEQNNPRQLYRLLIILVLLLGFTLYLLPQDPIIRTNLIAKFGLAPIPKRNALDPAILEANDPQLGTTLPMVGAGKEIRQKTAKNPQGYLLVGIGDCGSCISFSFKRWAQAAKDYHLTLIGFSNSSSKEIKKFQEQLTTNMPIIRDEQKKLSDQINCYWAGRVYYYDANWQLRWKMHSFEDRTPIEQLEGLMKLVKENKK